MYILVSKQGSFQPIQKTRDLVYLLTHNGMGELPKGEIPPPKRGVLEGGTAGNDKTNPLSFENRCATSISLHSTKSGRDDLTVLISTRSDSYVS
jgi:hypothetical protein